MAKSKPVTTPQGMSLYLTVFWHYCRSVWQNALPILLLLAVWELVARSGLMHPGLFPAVSQVIPKIIGQAHQGLLYRDITSSLVRLMWGLAIGIGFGTAAGLLLGYVKSLERWLVPLFQFFISIPGVTLFPLAIMWWGLGEKALIYVVGFEAAITITFNCWTGMKSINETLINAARSMGIQGSRLYWKVFIPASLPYIVAGYRVGFSRAWRVLVAGELIAASGSGLGFRIFHAQQFMDTQAVYGGIIVVGVLGLLFERLVLRSLEVLTVERWGTLRA